MTDNKKALLAVCILVPAWLVLIFAVVLRQEQRVKAENQKAQEEKLEQIRLEADSQQRTPVIDTSPKCAKVSGSQCLRCVYYDRTFSVTCPLGDLSGNLSSDLVRAGYDHVGSIETKDCPTYRSFYTTVQQGGVPLQVVGFRWYNTSQGVVTVLNNSPDAMGLKDMAFSCDFEQTRGVAL